jgi:long-chain fatty acid transport protein
MVLTIASGLMLGAWSGTARATDGLEPIGVSAQARMRGGADVAVGDSALSQITNPATLALWRTPQFDFSGQLLMPRAEWQGPIGAAHTHTAHPLMSMAAALPIDERLTLGAALHAKSGLGAHYRMRHLLMPWHRRHVASDMKDLSLSLNAGYRLTDKLSVGLGGRFEIATTRFNAVLGPVDMSFSRAQAYGGGFDLGLHYQATERLALGLAYRSPTWFGDMGGANLKASVLGLLPLKLGSGALRKFRLPQQVSAGVCWDATDWLRLHGEARWTDYARSTFHDAQVVMKDLGGFNFPLPLAWTDQWTFIVGAEIRLGERWMLGLGYNYVNDVVPPAHLFPIAAPAMQHHASIGLRYQRENWWVGGGYILGIGRSLEGGGRCHIPLAADYGGSRITALQHSLFVGFGFSL